MYREKHKKLKKNKINILIAFSIFHKSNVKTFLKFFVTITLRVPINITL